MYKGYRELVQKVKKVNRQAALVLAKQIPLQAKRNKKLALQDVERLLSAFVWRETKQGGGYWLALQEEVKRG
jgi:hypothetical protein